MRSLKAAYWWHGILCGLMGAGVASGADVFYGGVAPVWAVAGSVAALASFATHLSLQSLPASRQGDDE